MGVGVFARLQHTPGIRQWDPRADNRVPICASIWDQNLRLGPALSANSYLEMGSVISRSSTAHILAHVSFAVVSCLAPYKFLCYEFLCREFLQAPSCIACH